MDVKEVKGQRVVTNAGKHSVEVNVRISRAGGEKSPLPVAENYAECKGQLRSQNNNTGNGFMNFRKGSWADLLSSQARHPASAIGKSTHKSIQHLVTSTGTQTESHSPASTISDVNSDLSERQSKEYMETINQLHQLCETLKEELSQLSFAKDQMETKLLGVIREKDVVISSFHKSHTSALSQVEAVTTAKAVATEAELSQFRGVIRDVRCLINQEVDEMKRRAAYPLVPPNPQLAKFLQHVTFNDTDATEGGGDGHQRNGHQHNDNSDDTCSSSSSIPSAIGEFGNGDCASTKYLKL